MDRVIDALKAEQSQLRTRLAKIDAAIEEYERWAKPLSISLEMTKHSRR